MKKLFIGMFLAGLLAGCTRHEGVPFTTSVMMNVLEPLVGDPKDPRNTKHVSFLLYKKDLTPELSNGITRDMCQKYPNARVHFIDLETKKEFLVQAVKRVRKI